MINKDEIIQMARDAGYEHLPTVRLAYQGFDIERFAALVAAKAKEEMLEAGNDEWLEEVRRQERRKCATACYVKAYEINAMGNTDMPPAKAAELCAAAISEMP